MKKNEPFAKYLIDDDEGMAPMKLRGAQTHAGYDPPEVVISVDDAAMLIRVIESYARAAHDATVEAMRDKFNDPDLAHVLTRDVERRLENALRSLDFDTLARNVLK